jgi:hypothetical protein
MIPDTGSEKSFVFYFVWIWISSVIASYYYYTTQYIMGVDGMKSWVSDEEAGGHTYFLPQVDGFTHTTSLPSSRSLSEVEWEALA